MVADVLDFGFVVDVLVAVVDTDILERVSSSSSCLPLSSMTSDFELLAWLRAT